MAVAKSRTFIVVQNLTIPTFTTATRVKQVWFYPVLLPFVSTNELGTYTGIDIIVQYAVSRLVHIWNKLSWL